GLTHCVCLSTYLSLSLSLLLLLCSASFFFLFHHPSTTELYTLSLHDALPIFTPEQYISSSVQSKRSKRSGKSNHLVSVVRVVKRSEEHTSELESRFDLVCRLLLEKKNKKNEQ